MRVRFPTQYASRVVRLVALGLKTPSHSTHALFGRGSQPCASWRCASCVGLGPCASRAPPRVVLCVGHEPSATCPHTCFPLRSLYMYVCLGPPSDFGVRLGGGPKLAWGVSQGEGRRGRDCLCMSGRSKGVYTHVCVVSFSSPARLCCIYICVSGYPFPVQHDSLRLGRSCRLTVTS